MHQFRLAVATRCFELPLRESLRLAADCGAEGVQFDLRQELPFEKLGQTGRRDLLCRLDELGVRVAGTTVTLRRGLTDEQELDRRIAALKQAMKWSSELKSKVLTFRIGRLPKEQDSKPAHLLQEILSDLAQYANHVGVALAVTPVHDSAIDLQQVLSSIQTGPMGVDFDPAQFALAGHDPVDALRRLHDLTYHVQLRDGLSEIDGAAVETPVGQGSVPWLELLAMLGEMDYSGWLTAVRTQGNDKSGDLRRAIQYVRRMLLGG